MICRIALVTSAIVAATALAQPLAPTLKIDAGTLVGSADAASGIDIYRGIPFASPPVGALRWRAPQPVVPWSGVRPAMAFGHSCIQRGGGGLGVDASSSRKTASRSTCTPPPVESRTTGGL